MNGSGGVAILHSLPSPVCRRIEASLVAELLRGAVIVTRVLREYDFGVTYGVLLVENVPADLRHAPLFPRPVRADIGGVIVEGALQHRGISAVVDRLGDLARTLPFFAFGLGQRGVGGPREGAFLVHDAA